MASTSVKLKKKAQKKLVEKLPVILPKVAAAGAFAVKLPGGTGLPGLLRKIPNAGPMIALVAAPNLAGKRLVITGAARGFGAGLAQLVVKEGCRVALLGIEADELEAVTAKIVARRGDWAAKAFPCDVRDQEQVTKAMDDAAAWMGGIDMVVANAGIAFFGSTELLDPAKFEAVLDVNLLGAVRTARAAVPHLRTSAGHIMIVSSMAAAIQSPMHGAYTASKAGVAAFAHSLRIELAPEGITVGIVHPTFAATDMMTKDTITDPIGGQVWGGNSRGMWKMVEPKQVVQAMRDGLATRARRVVVPRRLFPVVWAPGVFQPAIERTFAPRMAALRASDIAASTPAASMPIGHTPAGPEGPRAGAS